MRCVGKEQRLSRVPSSARGGAAAANAHAKGDATSWCKLKCIDCDGPVYVKGGAVHKYGKSWRCKSCKKTSKLECIHAALAVAQRKKAMGIKW